VARSDCTTKYENKLHLIPLVFSSSISECEYILLACFGFFNSLSVEKRKDLLQFIDSETSKQPTWPNVNSGFIWRLSAFLCSIAAVSVPHSLFPFPFAAQKLQWTSAFWNPRYLESSTTSNWEPFPCIWCSTVILDKLSRAFCNNEFYVSLEFSG